MKANTYLIINRYLKSSDRRPYVSLACERGDALRKNTKRRVEDEEEEVPIKNRGPYRTKKCGCPFKCKWQQVRIVNCSYTTGATDARWMLVVPIAGLVVISSRYKSQWVGRTLL
ncbi:hypothetical protein M9H77_12916 [Catharanthus roseus]|uniref:Uncharacterized protein n=1 Tax=Catharanthus roseus TaxID=4058 RepID=A0ACC0BIX4_CATRO|nr:hypothetical protein M9H77_12916 [Catharanthus roseus]